MPISSTGTARMTAFCEATIAIDTPVPATISGGTSSQYATLASAIHAIHPNPAACMIKPPTTSGRSPIRFIHAPAAGATKNSVTVHGSSRTPADSGPSP